MPGPTGPPYIARQNGVSFRFFKSAFKGRKTNNKKAILAEVRPSAQTVDRFSIGFFTHSMLESRSCPASLPSAASSFRLLIHTAAHSTTIRATKHTAAMKTIGERLAVPPVLSDGATTEAEVGAAVVAEVGAEVRAGDGAAVELAKHSSLPAASLDLPAEHAEHW